MKNKEKKDFKKLTYYKWPVEQYYESSIFVFAISEKEEGNNGEENNLKIYLPKNSHFLLTIIDFYIQKF